MKKIARSLATGLLLLTAAACAERDTVSRNATDLPAPAQDIVARHFPQAKVSYIKIEKDFLGRATYEVRFIDGTEIAFDNRGEWVEVDCKRGPVPTAFVPQEIGQQAREMFPDAHVTKIEREWREYEVELSNNVELTFDKRFHLREVD